MLNAAEGNRTPTVDRDTARPETAESPSRIQIKIHTNRVIQTGQQGIDVRDIVVGRHDDTRGGIDDLDVQDGVGTRLVVKNPEDQIRVIGLTGDGATGECVGTDDRGGVPGRNGGTDQGPLPCTERGLHDGESGVVTVAEHVSDFVGQNGE